MPPSRIEATKRLGKAGASNLESGDSASNNKGQLVARTKRKLATMQ
eukprot:CAMPEP_0206537042 /NCGR_PEP_ID=MMETSP0325_2-20121206/7100_1 /ASSEMBLY_ACC=CAM_ASM_000347 /TAXON_ID=2866 /ORGANISM="Crypthecodinium cohnii, Strain Seligo" /LENGTH=45 /DNA_ID= /DNA_START= /DNA_END= /DNA_ORIENTATION=